MIIYKKENPGEIIWCDRAKSWLFLMNHENAIYYCINRVKPNYRPFYMRAAPSTTYGGISIDPSSGLSGPLQLVVRRTRLTVSVVLTTDHVF